MPSANSRMISRSRAVQIPTLMPGRLLLQRQFLGDLVFPWADRLPRRVGPPSAVPPPTHSCPGQPRAPKLQRSRVAYSGSACMLSTRIRTALSSSSILLRSSSGRRCREGSDRAAQDPDDPAAVAAARPRPVPTSEIWVSATEVSRLRKPERTINDRQPERIFIPASAMFWDCSKLTAGSRATSASPHPLPPRWIENEPDLPSRAHNADKAKVARGLGRSCHPPACRYRHPPSRREPRRRRHVLWQSPLASVCHAESHC